MMRKFEYLVLLSLMIASLGLADEWLISGRVRDANTHRVIPGVSVYIEGTGTMTDVGGRFRFSAASASSETMVTFQHLAYDTLILSLDEVNASTDIFMQERVIPLPAIQVEASAEKLRIEDDLPQSIAVLESREFEMRGFLDAGDLLRTEQSVQVEEDISGKKTVAIRGGNSDEVVVLYNGIKLNSTYDNIFDMSLIDLEDVQRIEVIKGSNTVLYGSEAFSGVINIVPKREQDYTIRLQQRFGTYASGNWGAHLYANRNRFYGSYSLKQGGARRLFAGLPDKSNALVNKSQHHNVNLMVDLDAEPGTDITRSLNLMYVRSKLDYENERDLENLLNFNQMVSAQLRGDFGLVSDLDISVAYQWLDEAQDILDSRDSLFSSYTLRERSVDNRSLNMNLNKGWTFNRMSARLGYQLAQTTLDFVDTSLVFGSGGTAEIPIGIEQAQFSRTHQGFVGIIKLTAPQSENRLFKNADFDVSFRYDDVVDRQEEAVLRGVQEADSVGLFDRNQWNRGMLKFSSHLSGGRDDFAFNGFMNFGTNIKFPTLFQQISQPHLGANTASRPNLEPEENRSLEIGLDLTWDTRHHPAIYGVQIGANYFKNTYKNKFKTFFIPFVPVAFYENVINAEISGIEIRSTLYAFRKKVAAEVGLSFYNISDKEAFPFKHDNKQTLKLVVDHNGYSFQFLWFNEGEQIGAIRNLDLEPTQLALPGYSNIDLHAGKFFEIKRLKLFLNASVRNLLDDDLQLQGLALRDRRYYVTLAAQY